MPETATTETQKHVKRCRELYWDFYYDRITLAEMQEEIKKLSSKQMKIFQEEKILEEAVI